MSDTLMEKMLGLPEFEVTDFKQNDNIMTLGERVQTILAEQKIKQIEFAKNLGISANYVNLIVNNKKETISDTLAMLIEEIYGYSAQWIINGSGEKLATNEMTAEKSEILKKIQKKSGSEVRAVLAFVNSLDSLNKEKRE